MDKIFADGVQFKLPRQGAPEYVKGSLSFRVADAVKFLESNQNNAGWVNCDIKESKGGKLYVELNTYVPEKPTTLQGKTEEQPPEEDSGVPF